MKHKKVITITHAFQIIIDDSNGKPNKIRINKGTEFYNKSVNPWLQKMHPRHNQGKSVVPEKFIRTLKNKIYKHKTWILKNVHIDRMPHIVDK